MTRNIAILSTAALLSAATLLAQGGPRGAGNQAAGLRQTVAPAAVQTVQGKITSIHIGLGMEYPSIQVDGKLIKLAPVWYLLENDFELKENDEVRVQAAQCALPDCSYLYAISIEKLSGGKLDLRSADGMPLWVSRGASGSGVRQGNGPGAGQAVGTGCVDPASIQSVEGTVESVNSGAGIQQPKLVLKTSSGLLTILLGPERVLLDADFELKAGQPITVRVGMATCSDTWVALSITMPDGAVLKLRNDDGTPAWN